MSSSKLNDHGKEDIPFLNRVREKGLLFEHLRSASSGRGGMVLLEGEAGVGKSRLVNEIIGEALARGFHHIAGKCLEYRKTPYFPFIDMLKEHFKLRAGQARGEAFEQFSRTLAEQHPPLVAMEGQLFDLLQPMNELVGPHRVRVEELQGAVEDLKRRGFRAVIMFGEGVKQDIVDLFDRSERTVLDPDDPRGLSPRRLERLAISTRELFSSVSHCVLIDCAIPSLLRYNPADKVRRLLGAIDQMSIESGGACLHVEMEGCDPLMDQIRSYKVFGQETEGETVEVSKVISGEHVQAISHYELVSSIFLELSRKDPLLIVIEDLQWGEKTTLNLLQYMARAACMERILILGSYRPEGMGVDENDRDPSSNPLREALRRFSREKLFEVITLGRFDINTTGHLLESMLGHPVERNVLEKVFRETDGNPRYVIDHHLARSSGDSPLSVQDGPILEPADEMVIRRVNALEPAARDAIEAISIVGGAARLEDMKALTDRGEEELLDAIDSLEKMRLVRETEDGFVFEHNKARESVHSNISPDRRAEMHLRMAQCLEKDMDDSDPEMVSRVASHFFLSDRPKKALELSLRCSEMFLERSHLELAQVELERALLCLDRIDGSRDDWTVRTNVMMSLGDIHQRKGELFRALNRYNEARDLSERRSMTSGLPSIHRRIGDTLMRLFDWEQTIDNYLRALHLAKRANDQTEMALTFKGLGKAYYLKGDYSRALDCYMRFLENPTGSRSSTYVMALQEIGDIYSEMGDFNQALTYYKLAIRAGEEKGLQKETTLTHVRMSNVLMRVGDIEESRRFSDLASNHLRDNITDDITEKALIGHIEMMIEFGDLQAAEEGANLLPGGLQGAGSDRLIDAIKARINGLMLARRRDFDASRSEMDRSMMVLQELSVPFQLAMTYFHAGLIRFQCMEVERARELLMMASEVFKTIKSLHYMSRTASKLREVTFIMEGLKR